MKLYTLNHAAKLLGIKTPSLYRQVNEGRIKTITITKPHVRIEEEELNRIANLPMFGNRRRWKPVEKTS